MIGYRGQRAEGSRHVRQRFAHQTCGGVETHPQDLCALLPERGFSLITAIFLLVVIASLGIFAVTLSTTQHQSQALDVMGSRAYHAARAGIEWAAYNVSLSPASSPAAAVCATSPNLGTLGGTLAPFTVTVSCSATSHVEGVSTVWVYEVSSTAATGGSPGDQNYLERVITVKMGR